MGEGFHVIRQRGSLPRIPWDGWDLLTFKIYSKCFLLTGHCATTAWQTGLSAASFGPWGSRKTPSSSSIQKKKQVGGVASLEILFDDLSGEVGGGGEWGFVLGDLCEELQRHLKRSSGLHHLITCMSCQPHWHLIGTSSLIRHWMTPLCLFALLLKLLCSRKIFSRKSSTEMNSLENIFRFDFGDKYGEGVSPMPENVWTLSWDFEF